MRTVVVGHNPEVEDLIARRQALGQDRFDEVWDGEYHVAPAPNAAHALVDHALVGLLFPHAQAAGLKGSTAFNVGNPSDYRVPDGGYHADELSGTWVQTAAIVVEIVSPGDETFAKFDFYAAHEVGEIIVADPAERSIRCFERLGDHFVEVEASRILGVRSHDVAAAMDWPAT